MNHVDDAVELARAELNNKDAEDVYEGLCSNGWSQQFAVHITLEAISLQSEGNNG